MSRVRVMLVDDNAGYRSRLRALLQRDPEVQVVAEAPDGETAVAIAGRSDLDVALVDLSMPGIGGYETAAKLRAANQHLAVLMLSIHSAASQVPAAFRPGAHAHLSKADPIGAVLSAIKAHVAAGEEGQARTQPAP